MTPNSKITALMLSLCVAIGYAPANSLGASGPAGTEETPILDQVTYELKSKTPAGIQTEYVSELCRRTDYQSGGSISIWNFQSGENHFLNPLTHRDMFRQGRPSQGQPRYYDGRRWLKNLGPCSYIGEVGTLWLRPAFGYADEEKACITHDGVILATIDGVRETKTPIELKRRAIPASMCDIPAGYTR